MSIQGRFKWLQGVQVVHPFAQAERAGRALRYSGKSSQLSCWSLHSPRELKYDVHSEVLSKVIEKDAATQTELTKTHEKHAKLHISVQASGYREFPCLSVDCSSAGSRMRCDQVDKLLSLVEI